MASVSRWRHLQHAAQWLDPEGFAVLVDERPDYFKRRSSSAWAKKALATLRISLARLSSRISRSSSLMRGSAEGWGLRGKRPCESSCSRSEQCNQSCWTPPRWPPTGSRVTPGLRRPFAPHARGLRGKLRWLWHSGSSFSKGGASAIPGAVQAPLTLRWTTRIGRLVEGRGDG